MISKVEICGVNTAKLPVLKDKEMKEGTESKLIKAIEECKAQFK